MSDSKQCEFDFEQYQEPRRTFSLADYYKQAFSQKPAQKPILSTDSTERKNTPMYSGALMYFPLALAAVARHSKRSNDKHNPGEPLHWSREKSDDHLDCLVRHTVDANHFNTHLNEYEEAAALAWRALAHLQILEEKRLGKCPDR